MRRVHDGVVLNSVRCKSNASSLVLRASPLLEVVALKAGGESGQGLAGEEGVQRRRAERSKKGGRSDGEGEEKHIGSMSWGASWAAGGIVRHICTPFVLSVPSFHVCPAREAR